MYGNMRTENNDDDELNFPVSTGKISSSTGELVMPLVPPVDVHFPEMMFVPDHLLPRGSATMVIRRDTLINIYQQLCHFAPLDSALHYHGIKPMLFYKIMAWAAENPDSEWNAVLELMNRGFAQPMITSLGTIAKAAQTNWQASAWFVEKIGGLKPVVASKTVTGSADKDADNQRERSAEELRNDILQRLSGIARSLPDCNSASIASSAEDVTDAQKK
jgi:hypothetical protein